MQDRYRHGLCERCLAVYLLHKHRLGTSPVPDTVRTAHDSKMVLAVLMKAQREALGRRKAARIENEMLGIGAGRPSRVRQGRGRLSYRSPGSILAPQLTRLVSSPCTRQGSHRLRQGSHRPRPLLNSIPAGWLVLGSCISTSSLGVQELTG